MARLTITDTVAKVPSSSIATSEAFDAKLETMPDLFELVVNCPAMLKSFLSLSAKRSQRTISIATQESIALAIAEAYSNPYCITTQGFIAATLLKLGRNSKTKAATSFALDVAKHNGQICEPSLKDIKAAGFDEEQVIEIVLLVASNIWINNLKRVAGRQADYPLVMPF